MPVATVEGVGGFEGQAVTLRGWLAARRSSGKLHFLQVRDGTGTIQCVVVKSEVPEAVFTLADHVPQESSVEVDGVVRADPRSPIGFELGVTDLRVVQRSAEYPITPKEHGTAFLLDHRHLWLRSSRQHAILRVRAAVMRACREYLDEHGFVAFDAPILTPAACEGTTTLFPSSTSARRPTSRRAGSSTARRAPWRSAASTSSGRRSAPRSRRRGAT
jgi:asparaginyl-tRNA synthetase